MAERFLIQPSYQLRHPARPLMCLTVCVPGRLQGVVLLVALFFTSSATTAFAARRRHASEVGRRPNVRRRCAPVSALAVAHGAAARTGRRLAAVAQQLMIDRC